MPIIIQHRLGIQVVGFSVEVPEEFFKLFVFVPNDRGILLIPSQGRIIELGNLDDMLTAIFAYVRVPERSFFVALGPKPTQDAVYLHPDHGIPAVFVANVAHLPGFDRFRTTPAQRSPSATVDDSQYY